MNPRIYLQNYPKEIQNAAIPKNEKEKRNTRILRLFFIIIFIGFPVITTSLYSIQNNESISFLYYILHFVIILQLANLNDLLVLDWLILCKITPKFIVIPGTNKNPGYKNYRFYFLGFIKGIFIAGLFSVLLALICFSLDTIFIK
jgi:hypothetical protein